MDTRSLLANPVHGLVPAARPGQVDMGGAIDDFLNGPPGVALFEGPTGVGKSIAYLTPLVTWLREVPGVDPETKFPLRRAVVSTGKKTLQAQLLEKDIPHVLNIVGQVPVVLMKGKGNYLCRARLAALEKELSPDLARVRNWAYSAATEVEDDLERCDGVLGNVKGRVNVETCDALKCEYARSCGYVAMRARVTRAKLVVVNHALLALDLRFDQKVIGPYSTLVCDEAHALPRAFRDAFTYRFSRSQVMRLRTLFHVLDLTGAERAYTLFTTADELLRVIERRPIGEAFTPPEDFAEICAPFLDASEKLVKNDLALILGDGHEREFVHGDTSKDRTMIATAAAAKVTSDLLEEMTHTLERTITPVAGNLEFFAMVESLGTSTAVGLTATPLEVGGVLSPKLKGIRHVVLTSATLAVGKDARATLADYGLAHATPLHRFPSSFDYRRHSALYIPAAAPCADYSKREECRAWWPGEMRDLLVASRGGAFVLCASYDDLSFFYDTLRKDPALNALNIIKQDGSIEPAVAQFRANPCSVLVGVDSLWEGVDVPGPGLRLVVIPRLPNPNVKDPLLYARSRSRMLKLQEHSGFDALRAQELVNMELKTLPMCLRVIQGAGRLIRSAKDKGVVAVLDGRLYGSARGYSAMLRQALPHPWVDDKTQVLAYLAALSRSVTAPR